MLRDGDIAEIWQRFRTGEQQRDIARATGCSAAVVGRVIGARGGVAPARYAVPYWERSPLRLHGTEREEISRGLRAGESVRQIAHRLERAPSTISREIRRNGGRVEYRAWNAQTAARARERRPRVTRLARHPRLRAEVERMLLLRWSPVQISRRLRLAHPHDREMRVSHETIYRALYIQGRGELRRELAACLRTGRARRRAQAEVEDRGRMAGMVLISERPAEIADRAVPGHWEGDLVLGRNGKSAIATLVERRTRYVLLAALPGGRTAPEVRDALVGAITTLPAHLRQSLTWDRGHEMADHLRFTIDTGVAVYFCDPHSPWQRGTNENTNGLLRQYLPRSVDLREVSQNQLDAIAAELNGRPRQTLAWRSPSEAFAEAVAATD
ncbi:MAG: integrase [Chloroflexi bacterium RBG_16_72_14]|nr:MAG: integrase [Chloroflexi bacterium RBG_16_72_14]